MNPIASSCKAMLAISAFPRPSFSVPSNGGTSTSFSLVGSRFVRDRCVCLVLGSKERPSSRRMAVLALDAGAKEEVNNPRPFLCAKNEGELLSLVRKEVETGRLSSNIADGLEELFRNYRNAVLQSGIAGANEIALSNMAVVFDRILLDLEDPFTFSPHHVAIREPFDYYMFVQNYIRPLIDFRNSYIGNISLFYEMEQKLQKGHNIVLISNHQTEADPGIITVLIERTHSYIAEKMVYVAGDRVITDPLCKPFSMGRNLLCVYSKKHMNDDPELIEKKQRANTQTLKDMTFLLRSGSQIIWIAPSGGRDRPDPCTGEWYPEPFDSSAVNNMRRILEYTNVPGHIYPLALLSYEVMPPPPRVEKQIGEQRKISFHGVGLSVAPEMNFEEVTADCENSDVVSSLDLIFLYNWDGHAKEAFSQALYDSVTEQYMVLKSAIYGCDGLDASNFAVSLSQPWQ